LAARLDKLYRSFRRLRSLRWWKARVQGGAAVVEVKRGADSGRWHPHLHLVVTGKYLDQKELSERWHRVTGDSYIVDVRLIHDGDAAADYLTKYLTKPASNTLYRDANSLQELIVALHGRHQILTFGTWRGWRLTETTTETKWQDMMTLRELLSLAEAGDPQALQILATLKGKNTWTYNPHPEPRPP